MRARRAGVTGRVDDCGLRSVFTLFAQVHYRLVCSARSVEVAGRSMLRADLLRYK